MPLFTEHIETGILLIEQGRPVLAMGSGGRCRLEFDRVPRDLFGNRVTVRGVRDEFDLLYVSAWAKGNDTPAARSKMPRSESVFWVCATTIGAALFGSLGHQLWMLARALLE